MTLSEIIAKLEAATEGSRELDRDIAIVLRLGEVEWDDGRLWIGRFNETATICPMFSTSLDAALTLVPSNCAYYLQGPVAGVAHIWGHGIDVEENAGTVPLALCIASLRAREK